MMSLCVADEVGWGCGGTGFLLFDLAHHAQVGERQGAVARGEGGEVFDEAAQLLALFVGVGVHGDVFAGLFFEHGGVAFAKRVVVQAKQVLRGDAEGGGQGEDRFDADVGDASALDLRDVGAADSRFFCQVFLAPFKITA